VYEVDVDGRLRYVNTAFAVIVGRRPKEIIGERLIDVLDPATQFRFDDDANQVVVRRADGIVRMLDIQTAERRVDGELVGYDGTVRDLTAAVHFEELRNDLLALIGVELRQPLSTILGLGATLESHAEEFERASVESIGERIRQQAERLSRLTDDLSEMSRLEYDPQLVNRRELDVAATVRDGLGAVAGGDAVHIDVSDALVAFADRRRVEQVVANLVENALHYGAPPVVVSATRAGDEVVISVRDHGNGVPDEHLDELFSKLTLTGLPRRRGVATGLGLALVRGLVEAMGGRVWYEADAHGGADFRFTLPVA
jgi:PAS domain S-box-containing protein